MTLIMACIMTLVMTFTSFMSFMHQCGALNRVSRVSSRDFANGIGCTQSWLRAVLIDGPNEVAQIDGQIGYHK